MRIFSYVVEHDYGFAPNPFYQVCTLAACKPKIRKHANIGDYVIGTGATKPRLVGRLVYWMRIDEILSFDDYWQDVRFRAKRPFMRGSCMQRFGDNIYHSLPDGGGYVQEDSFHSKPEGVLDQKNFDRDTGSTSRVLVGFEYAYWGRKGPAVPAAFSDFVHKSQGHKCRFPNDRVERFLRWLDTLPERGFCGEPAHWQFMRANSF